MIKKLLILCFLFMAVLYSCDPKTNTTISDSKNDSVKKYLDLAGNDTLPFVDRIKYNDKAYSFIDLRRNDTASINLLYKASLNFYRLNDLKKLKVASILMLRKSLLLKNKYWIGMSYKTIGLYYMNNSENEKSLYHLFKAKKILTSLNNNIEVMNVLFNISLTQSYACDFLGSNITCFEILKKAKRLGINIASENIYIQIGNNLASLKQDKKAIEYYQKIDKKNIRLKFKNIIANDISYSYIELGDYQKAKNELNTILKNKYLKKTTQIITLSL